MENGGIKLKSIVFYYSFTGKCKKKSEAIARIIEADTYQVIEVKKRNIFGAYIFGSRSAMLHKSSNIMPISVDINKYDRIMIISPIWASTITPAIFSLIRSINIKGKNIIAAYNQAGYDSIPADSFKKEIEANGGNVITVLNLSKASTDEELTKLLADAKLL